MDDSSYSDTLSIITEQIRMLKISSNIKELSKDQIDQLDKLIKLKLLLEGEATEIVKNSVISLNDYDDETLIKELKKLRKKSKSNLKSV